MLGEKDERIGSLVSILIDKLDGIEVGIESLHDGQKNIKAEYLQSMKLLNITSERRDRKLIKEIRQRLDDKKEKNNNNILKRLLPWNNKGPSD